MCSSDLPWAFLKRRMSVAKIKSRHRAGSRSVLSLAAVAFVSALAANGAQAKTLLEYNFENYAVGDIVGLPSMVSNGISSTLDMANNGVESIGSPSNNVSVTRFAGKDNFPLLSFQTSAPISLDKIEFLHLHNHNLGFPTFPSYDVDLQLDQGFGFKSIAVFLANSWQFQSESITGPGLLAPGNYALRWIPLVEPNTNTEYFSLDNIRFVQADPVPGPLPLAGAGMALAFSRKLKRRIRS